MSLVVEDVDSFVRKRGRKRRGVEVEKDGRRETKLRRWRESEGRERAKGRKEGEGRKEKKKKTEVCMSQCLDFFSVDALTRE